MYHLGSLFPLFRLFLPSFNSSSYAIKISHKFYFNNLVSENVFVICVNEIVHGYRGFLGQICSRCCNYWKCDMAVTGHFQKEPLDGEAAALSWLCRM